MPWHVVSCRASVAVLAVALWVYAPSRLQDVWNIGNLSGFIGTALLPWMFFTLARLIDQPTRRRMVWLALVFGGVILAHQPTTVLAALVIVPAVPVWCGWVARRNGHFVRRLAYTIGGLALGAGVAMIFLLPTLAEVGYVKVSLAAEDIPSVLRSGFLLPSQLFMQPAAPDLTDISRGLPDTLGLVGGLLGGLGFLALLSRRKFPLALAWAAILAFCIFLLLDISFGFWLTVPLLDQLRFPARVLRMAVVFLSLLGGASFLLLPLRYRGIASAALVALVIAAALPTLYPSRDVVDYTGITPADEIRYEQATYSFGGTSYDEFRPIWASRPPFDSPPDVEAYATDPMRIAVVDPHLPGVTIESTGDTSVHVVTPDTFALSFRHFYFPGWRAMVDGESVDVYPTSDFGLITVDVPPGDHTVTLFRQNTPIENLSALLTLISLGIAVILFRKRPAPDLVSQSAPQPLSPRLAGGLIVGVIVFAILNRVYILPDTTWFRQISPPDNPAAMQTPVQVAFGDAYELLGYSLDEATASPGKTFRITLFWRALRPLDHTYRPLVQLTDPALTEAWAVGRGFFCRRESHCPYARLFYVGCSSGRRL